MHLDRYVEYLEGLIAKKQNIPENTRKLDEAKALIEEKGNTVNLAASLVIMPDPQAKLKLPSISMPAPISPCSRPSVHLSGLYMRESAIP